MQTDKDKNSSTHKTDSSGLPASGGLPSSSPPATAASSAPSVSASIDTQIRDIVYHGRPSYFDQEEEKMRQQVRDSTLEHRHLQTQVSSTAEAEKIRILRSLFFQELLMDVFTGQYLNKRGPGVQPP